MSHEKESRLAPVRAAALACRGCRLHATRKTVVFGEGSPDAEVMFIGEGPGRTEDETGRPFVGRAGELLTRIIEGGMGYRRDEVYIANLVKCRPTVDQAGQRDRPPEPDELAACIGFLQSQIETIAPKVIVALGSPATKYLLNTTVGITKLRGQWGEYRGVPVMPTYHPSYVLRNGGDQSPLKRDVWEDIKKVLRHLGRPIPERRRPAAPGGNA